MKKRVLVVLLPVLAILLLSVTVFGQTASPASGKLRVRKLSGLGRRAQVYTPSFSTDVGRGVKSSQEWQAVTVSYDTAPEWIDELLIQFYVLSMKVDPETRQNVYSLFKVAVRYVDIEKGSGHMATVFLRPAALKRYGEPAAVAAVFTLGGEDVAELSEEKTNLPAKWWKNPLVTESDTLTTRDGYLLDRSQSPWAWINSDDYEVIK